MGIDYGLRRVGVALSDPTGLLATPLLVLNARDRDWALAELRRLAERYEVTQLVVGLALNMDRSEGPAALACREFGEILRKKTRLPVDYEDERLSTEEATRMLRSRGWSREKIQSEIDQHSACIILQAWLDSRTRPS